LEKTAKRVRILGYPLDLVRMKEAVEKIESSLASGKGGHVVTLNPEMIMQANKNSSLGEIIKSADLIVPDSIGIILALKRGGIYNIPQLPGIELADHMIKESIEKNYTLGFLGASSEVISILIDELKKTHKNINIVFSHNGYFDTEEEAKILEELKKAKPQILLVALGVPKQEFWIAKYKEILNSSVMIGVGGSFDVWAKKVKRAPSVFRKFGLEWFYRLISEPSRFGRMFPTLPLFLLKILFSFRSVVKEF
jgi:N-acetylglucosaminyldiphosphoundecaprenol N-acetyl-beta-D-mannosaminyltransferase